MKKSITPSKTKLLEVLRSVAFDPRAPGPMQIILETGDSMYLIARAVEELKTSLTMPQSKNREPLLKRAMSLLAMSILKTQEPAPPKPKKPKVKPQVKHPEEDGTGVV